MIQLIFLILTIIIGAKKTKTTSHGNLKLFNKKIGEIEDSRNNLLQEFEETKKAFNQAYPEMFREFCVHKRFDILKESGWSKNWGLCFKGKHITAEDLNNRDEVEKEIEIIEDGKEHHREISILSENLYKLGDEKSPYLIDLLWEIVIHPSPSGEHNEELYQK